MALYQVSPGGVVAAADLNQYYNLLTGATTDQQVTIANRIQATNTGAATASGYMGGVSGAAPASGTFALGDMVIDQKGPLWVCTTAGTPGSWASTPVQIATQTLGSTTASVTFSSIPTAFNHLALIWAARSTVAAVTDSLVVQLNGTTGASYYYAQAAFPNGTSSINDAEAQTNLVIGAVSGNTATAKYRGVGWTVLPRASDGANNYVTAVGINFYTAGESAGQQQPGIFGGTYKASAAITSIKLFAAGGSLAAGTQFSLYGLI